MTMARECTGCIHHERSTLNTWCLRYHRTTPLSLVAREHDPGRCWTATKPEPEEEPTP